MGSKKGHSDNNYDDSNYSFSDIRIFTEKDIFHISTEFGRGTHASRKIKFGIGRTKDMKGLLH